jgi:broad specificity phosphatase PhoE
VKKTTIHLIRHCEVQNSEHVIYGRLPGFYLCSRGLYQAEKLHEYFENANISAIITSPLERAMQTAEIISDNNIPIIIEKDILEADYRKWEGIRADKRDSKDVLLYIENPDKAHLGETLAQIEKRMRRAIESAINNYKGKKIVMVSHADPIIVARLSYEGRLLTDVNKCEVRNASITTLVFDEHDKFLKSSYKIIVEAKKDMP